jgi:hypothetical protein
LIVDASAKSSFAVPKEARDPISFELAGRIVGGRFDGRLTDFRRPRSDLIHQEEIRGSFNSAAKSLSFTTKAGLRFSVWPHADLPDQEGSRGVLLGDMNDLETASVFIGACGTS